MQGKRFSEEQIIRILHDAEASENVRDVCRQHNIAEQTWYRWRRQFGGMEISEAKRLRALQRENAELKRLVGELTLDNRMLKDGLGKNCMGCSTACQTLPRTLAPAARGFRRGCASAAECLSSAAGAAC